MNDPIISNLEVDHEPMDRLTGFCKVMTDALEEALDKEREADMEVGAMNEPSDVRGIIFLNDPHKGGIQMFGYTETSAGVADLLVHLKALFASMGKGFGVMDEQGRMLIPVEDR